MPEHPFIKAGSLSDHVTWTPYGMSDEDCSRKFAWVVEEALRWHKAVLPALPVPEPGSSLAADSAIPYLNVAGYVTPLIGHAVEHICFMGGSIVPKSNDDPTTKVVRVWPSAQHTVIRSAIMSASLALWMLASPSRAERQSHCLRYVWEDVRQQIASVKSIKPYIDSGSLAIDPAKYDEGLAQLKEQQQKLKDIAAEHDWPEPYSFQQTEVVQYAFDTIGFSDFPAILSMWREPSAAAHGLASHSFLHSEKIADLDDGVNSLYRSASSIQEISNLLGGAFVLTRYALNLLQWRSIDLIKALCTKAPPMGSVTRG